MTARMTCSISRMVEAGARIELAQERHHDIDLGWAQARHHLVEQQQPGFGCQRARHFQPLAVGQGEALGELVAAVEKAQAVENGGGAVARLGEMRLAVQRARR